MIPQAIIREFAHQARRRDASHLPLIPRCVGPAVEAEPVGAADPLVWRPAPLRVPIAERISAA